MTNDGPSLFEPSTLGRQNEESKLQGELNMTEGTVLDKKESMSLALRPNELPVGQSFLNSEQENLFRLVLTHPSKWEDGIIRPLLFFVSDHLRKHGVAEENIKAGLLAYTAMNSVRLGYPQSVILIAEDYRSASHLLNICQMIAPSNSIHEVQELKAEQLYTDQEFYRGRVVISYDTSAVVKAMPDLVNLLIMGRATRQADFKSKLGTGMKTFEAQYRMAFVGIENSAGGKPVITHPSIIRIPVSGDSCSKNLTPSLAYDLPNDRYEEEIRCIATMFERLSPRSVSIPYLAQLLTFIQAQRPENLPDKVNIVKKIISLSSIMADPPQSSDLELFRSYIKVGMSHSARPSGLTKAEGLKAGKLDYHQTSLLLDDVLSIGSKSFTRMETRIFDAVKLINFQKAGMAMLPQNSIIYKLTVLPRTPEWWAYMHDIMGTLNKSATVFISGPEIETVLGKLKTMKVIGEKRGESSKGEGFFILVPQIDSYLRLPDIKQIKHPSFDGPPIRIMNPVTGLIEEI
jgi:hypothetical protein